MTLNHSNTRITSRRGMLKACLAICCLLIVSTGLYLARDSFAAVPTGKQIVIDYTNEADGVEGSITYRVTKVSNVDSNGKVSYGNVMLVDGTNYKATSDSPTLVIDTISYEDEGTVYKYKVTAINREAFKNNKNIFSIEIASDLTDVADAKKGETDNDMRCAVGVSAFSGCTSLTSVAFTGSEAAAIGAYAFYNCTALNSVTFSDGFTLYSSYDGAAACGICRFAFMNCSSLKTIRIPAITSAKRTSDAYNKYASGVTGEDVSGYSPSWHDKNQRFGIYQEGLDVSVFRGAGLESIVFEAGCDTGLFAYWTTEGCGLHEIELLKTVIYEAAQPYYGNPYASMNNKTYRDIWGSETAVADPTFYYAVDYYLTSKDANKADAAGSTRLARVEYEADTPISLIQAGDATDLKSYVAQDSELYAETESDGTVLDPNEVAAQAQKDGVDGFENASDYEWVWMLGNSQSRRSVLTDSCTAYLVRADDLSTGRIEGNRNGEDQIQAMYMACDQNLSQGSIQNTKFDPARYEKGGDYNFSTPVLDNLSSKATAWFTLKSAGLAGLLSQLTMYDGEGNVIDISDTEKFSIVFYRYNSDTKDYEEAVLGDTFGPLLMTVTPLEGSGYDTNTAFKEWILVKGHEGSVVELYTDSASTTWSSAVYPEGSGYVSGETFDVNNGFAIGISSGDATSALCAVSYAGLVDGPISVVSSKKNYGFNLALPGEYTSYGYIKNPSNTYVFEPSALKAQKIDSTPSNFAASTYIVFNKNRDSYGTSSLVYPWGDTAVLVNPTYIEETAAAAAEYAYAEKSPIFYTEEDGTLSDVTIECLKDFKHVLVVGGTSILSEENYADVEKAVEETGDVSRLASTISYGDNQEEPEADTAFTLSYAAAGLINSGENPTATLSSVAIVIATDSSVVIDAISALDFSANEDGVLYVVSNTADAKRVAKYLRENRDVVSRIRIFGRNSDAVVLKPFNLISTLSNLWNEKADSVPNITKSDKVEIQGALFSFDTSKNLTFVSRLWGTTEIPAGTYAYGLGTNGKPVYYTLKEAVPASEKEADDKGDSGDSGNSDDSGDKKKDSSDDSNKKHGDNSNNNGNVDNGDNNGNNNGGSDSDGSDDSDDGDDSEFRYRRNKGSLPVGPPSSTDSDDSDDDDEEAAGIIDDDDNGPNLIDEDVTTANDEWNVFESEGGLKSEIAEYKGAAGNDDWTLALIVVVISLLAFAGAILYTTKFRRETDDLLEGTPSVA